jgi:extracellular factor (EF) 3-hydroxypalmitic acid methyl ester biosynthesis protein
MGRNIHNRVTTVGFDHACDNRRLQMGCGNRSSAQPEESLAFLDEIIRKLESEPSAFTAVLQDLMASLEGLRSQCLDLNEWHNIVAHLRLHRIYSLMLEDPYTLRATQKPRGYPGDALLLDFVYRHPLIARDVQQSSALGQRIYEYTGIESPPAKAVRNRRDSIAKILRSAVDFASIRGVLAFACGHLREFDVAFPDANSPFAQFIACDQHSEPLEVVQSCYGDRGITPVTCSLRQFLGPGIAGLQKLDLIYCLGLLDYLSDRMAARLLARFGDFLSPGGRLVTPNFAPNTFGAAYMEAFMDWWLVYRDEKRLESLLEQLPAGMFSGVRTFREHEGQIVFLDLVRG